MRKFIILTKDGRYHTILATSPNIAESIVVKSNKRYTLCDIQLTYEEN